MTEEKQDGRGFLASILRRGQPELAIDGYQAGDIEADGTVHLLPGAALAGNICAPSVIVGGVLYGNVVASELHVEAGGQLWGNACARLLQVAPAGEIHGWVQTIDEEAYRQLRENGGRLTIASKPELPADLLPPELAGSLADEAAPWSSRLALLRLLQQEAGAALAARTEIELTFEERVTEVAGDIREHNRALAEALSAARQEIESLEVRLADRGRLIEGQESRLQSQREELETIRAHLEERSDSLEQVEAQLQEKTQALAEAESHGQALEDRLNRAMTRADELAGRVESLESALQSSVQHSAEQEEALIRWQELAEVSTTQVSDLEQELAEAQEALVENERIAEQLRAERALVEEAREQTRAELVALEETLETSEPAGETDAQALQAAEARIAKLEATLAETEEAVVEQHSQLLWSIASLQTANASLNMVQEEVTEQQQTIAALEVEVDEHRSLADQWKSNVGRLSELLYEAESRVKEKDRRLQKLWEEVEKARAEAQHTAQLGAEKETLAETLRQRETEIAALEAEVDRYHHDIQAQGQRLAEARAELVEEKLALKQARSQLEQRTAEAKKIRLLASRRIKQLESDLEATSGQLHELMATMEREDRG